MSDDLSVSVLLAEYAAMREELRMILAAMDTGLRTGILMIGGLLAVSATLGDERVLFLIPTVIFLFGFGQFMRAACVNVLGVYCQAIEEKLRDRVGPANVVMSWEGSRLWRNVAHPSGVVNIGFYFVFGVVAIVFGVLAYRTYLYWKASLAIHLLEIILLIIYASLSMKWNLISTREKWVREVLKEKSN